MLGLQAAKLFGQDPQNTHFLLRGALFETSQHEYRNFYMAHWERPCAVSDWVTESVPPRSSVGHTHTKRWVRPAMPEPPRWDDMPLPVPLPVRIQPASSTEHRYRQRQLPAWAVRRASPASVGADRRQGFPEPRCATQFSPSSQTATFSSSPYHRFLSARCPPTPPRY